MDPALAVHSLEVAQTTPFLDENDDLWETKAEPSVRSLVLQATSCDVSGACSPLYYMSKQNMCLIFGCWGKWMGFGLNVAVKKHLHFSDLYIRCFWNTVASSLSFKYKTAIITGQYWAVESCVAVTLVPFCLEAGKSCISNIYFLKKEFACQYRRRGFHLWVRKIPLEKEMTTYSSLGNPIDRGSWRAIVHGVAESDTT